ncbi:winged helix DNA-binding domain-containing protein [Micromonospora halophytica]|uniref:Winged helix DNA-binding domain-containing protein n=1 Tax=Micromonospora halophytica TaxID=47864 RepID=A0A1C5IJW2_9ACTN|nr:winged helix DNA-binding domain-containing protein [Micromonospora halophytica]SCG58668.1 Winged helix DNA-binding domain-containing protein [Micromonospora halophytica]
MTDRSTLPRLSWSDVCARRLERHGLSAPVPDSTPADAVAAMCGAHAQVLSAAEVSIGLRVSGATRADVGDALWRGRSLVKTFGPRGTVHLLPARDLPLWAGALSAIPPASPTMPADVRLTPGQADEVVAAITAAVTDAELTVDELSAEVAARTGPWAVDPVMPAFGGSWPRWRQVMHLAAHRGALCFGPNRGRKVTYTSPQRWLPGFQPAPASEALADLVRRYLHAYGPATPQQFAQWLAAPRRWATALFDSLASELEQVEVDGDPAWVRAGDTAPSATGPHGVQLLPYFDAYTVGCHPRELLFPGPAAQRALAGGQAGNFPVLLIDGTVAGVWHGRRSGRRLHVTVEPLRPLSDAARRAVGDRVERLGEILECKPQVILGPVHVGGHA